MEKTFNLVDKQWIPTNLGFSSLKEIFSNEKINTIGGTPVSSMAYLNLIKTIAQAACTVQDFDELVSVSLEEFKTRCLAYLDKWHDSFDLYGEKPFLQMPCLKTIEVEFVQTKKKGKKDVSETIRRTIGKPFDIQEMAKYESDSFGVYSTDQIGDSDDVDKAQLVVVMAINYPNKKCGNRGKLSDLSVTLKAENFGKSPLLRSGVNFFSINKSVLETAFWNIVPQCSITSDGGKQLYQHGFGRPIWEEYPKSEACPRAQEIKNSYIGLLMPMPYFLLLDDDIIYIAPGLEYKDSDNVAYYFASCLEKSKPVQVSVRFSPYVAMRKFLGNKYESFILTNIFKRARMLRKEYCTIAAIGQYYVCKGAGLLYRDRCNPKSDDSAFGLNAQAVVSVRIRDDDNAMAIHNFNNIVDFAEERSNDLKKAIVLFIKYGMSQNEGRKRIASTTEPKAAFEYWSHVNRHLIKFSRGDSETLNEEYLKNVKKEINKITLEIYDKFCFKTTARHHEQWACCRPKYVI